MTDTVSKDFDFDVALSFAGEDRDYVDEVNDALKTAGVRTFLDSDYLSDTWGEDLVEFFDGVYRKRSRFALLFISRRYGEKMWPRHERRSALSRAIEERGAYILPIRLDDTELEGLRPTVGYLDARRVGIDGLVRAFLAKLSGRSTAAGGWPGDRAPRTQNEIDDVRANQPPGWEYLYFAGLLGQGVDSLKGKYLDHELGYASLSAERVEKHEFLSYMNQAIDEVKSLVRILDRLMDSDVQSRAFGPPGTPGDPERIQRLAMRWNSAWEGLLDWASRIRSVSHDDLFDRLFELLGQFADGPIEQYKHFVDEFVTAADLIPSALARHQPLQIEITLTISLREGLTEEYGAELERLVEFL